MASTSPSITSELETKFKSLADQRPPIDDAQLRASLLKAPTADPNLYYRWILSYRAQQVMNDYQAPPMSNAAAADLLKKTKYDDPASLYNIVGLIGNPTGVVPLPLGNFTADGTKRWCYISFSDSVLPRDFLRDENRPDTDLTYLQTDPDMSLLPKFFFQLGQLCLSSTATATGAVSSSFAVVVTLDRKVFAIWNPNGADPEFVPDNLVNSNSTTYKTRATSGKLPGFSAPCTAIPLASNIDTLCGPDQASKTLNISSSTFVTAPVGTSLRFGGVDRNGWLMLDKISKGFADWPRYSGPALAPSA